MSLAGCQINPIDVNFHLQKSLEIFDKSSADKIQSKKYKGIKVPSLMPIRVKLKILSAEIFLIACKLAQDPLNTKVVDPWIHGFVELKNLLDFAIFSYK